MQQIILLLLIIVLLIGIFGYRTYRNIAEKRAREKRRNQYHDRV